MKKIYWLILLLLVAFISCDRFDHNFETEDVPPEIHLVASPSQGYAPLDVTFADSTIAGTNSITNREWDFDNDGMVDANAQNSVFTYDNPGNYVAKLTVSDGIFIVTDSISISVLEAGSPIAAFHSDMIMGHAPITVSFTDDSQQGSFPITSWEWDFDGDGTIDSYEQNPEYTFTETGDIDIKLTVSDGNLTSEISQTISIKPNAVMAELFTATWCPNCPEVEHALYDLKETTFFDQLIYGEYHVGGDVEFNDNGDLLDYYTGNQSLPTTVVNGNEQILIGATDVEVRLTTAIQNVLASTFQAQIHVREETFSSDVYHAVLQIIFDEISTDNFFLRYVVMEDLDTEHTNAIGESLHNVVLYRGEQSLETYQSGENIEIQIENISAYPIDSTIIYWVQTVSETYNQNSCKIYNVLSKPISN